MTNQVKKIIFLSFLTISVGVIAVFFVIKYNNRSVQPNNIVSTTQTTKDDTTIDDETTTTTAVTTTTTQTTKAVAICATNETPNTKFTLSKDASVYNTSADAKSKTNPSGTYHAGEYFIYKCYSGMANITKNLGSPGGWIDPENPYVIPSSTTTSKPASIDVMSLNNTIVNWSHEYPSTFVSKYNGYWNIPGNNLYLTFDCGYDYNNLASTIMDILKGKNVKAVFFVTGDFMDDRPDLIRRMLAEGHIVGNHSYSHLNQPQNLNTSIDTVVNDIREWENKYRSIVGANPSAYYFRPPGGAVSERSMGLMNSLGYKTLLWGAAYKDWDTSAQPTEATAMEMLRKYTTAGDIILLHGISQTSTNILGQYIDEYRAKGFIFKLF